MKRPRISKIVDGLRLETKSIIGYNVNPEPREFEGRLFRKVMLPQTYCLTIKLNPKRFPESLFKMIRLDKIQVIKIQSRLDKLTGVK